MAGRWLETTTRRTDRCLIVSLALACVMLAGEQSRELGVRVGGGVVAAYPGREIGRAHV